MFSLCSALAPNCYLTVVTLTPLIPTTKVLFFVLFPFLLSPHAALTLTSVPCYLGWDSSLSLKLQCLLHHTGWHNCQQLSVIEPLTCHTLFIALLLIEPLLLFAFISFLPLDSLMSIFIASPWHSKLLFTCSSREASEVRRDPDMFKVNTKIMTPLGCNLKHALKTMNARPLWNPPEIL